MPEILLDEDQKAVLVRYVREAQQALAVLTDFAKESGMADAELAENVLSVTEYRLADISELLKVPSETEARVRERSAALREANLRVQMLEKKLGGTQSPEGIQAGLKTLADKLNAWWDAEGFGHISDIRFGPYGCDIDFSCHLFGDFHLTNSSTPVSDKTRKEQWYESLQARGFVLVEDSRDMVLEDSDGNRRVLHDLFASRFPSALVRSFENSHRHGAAGFTLRGVKVFVRDIADIMALPFEPVK